MQVAAEYANEDVVFLGLTSEGSEAVEESRAFIEATGMTWPNGYGARDTINALGVEFIPAVFVIGRDGTLFWRDEDGGTVEGAIAAALAEPWQQDSSTAASEPGAAD